MKLKLTRKQQQIAAVGVVMVGALGFVYFKFFWTPVSDRIEKATAKLESTTRKIMKAKKQAARLDQLRVELERLNERAAEAEKRLPKERGVPNILVAITKIAEQHQITINTFSPGGKAQRQFFIELSYPLSIKGSYHNLGKFLAELALQERIYNVVNVSYGSANSSGVMAINLTLLSYQYKG